MAYIEDLRTEIVSKLSLSNTGILLPKGTWEKVFIKAFRGSLPIGADYEVYYNVFYSYFELKEYEEAMHLSLKLGFNSTLVFFYKGLRVDPNITNIKKHIIYRKSAAWAAAYDRVQALKHLEDYHLDFVFQEALKYNSYAVIKFLGTIGALILNNQSLDIIIRRNDIALIDVLLANGVNIQAFEPSFYSTIEYAKPASVLHLLSKGLILNKQRALETALYSGNIAIMDLLISNGAEITVKILKTYDEAKLEVLRFLIPKFATVEDFNTYLLINASIKGNVDVVSFLLENGMNDEALLAKAIYFARSYRKFAIVDLIKIYN